MQIVTSGICICAVVYALAFVSEKFSISKFQYLKSNIFPSTASEWRPSSISIKFGHPTVHIIRHSDGNVPRLRHHFVEQSIVLQHIRIGLDGTVHWVQTLRNNCDRTSETTTTVRDREIVRFEFGNVHVGKFSRLFLHSKRLSLMEVFVSFRSLTLHTARLTFWRTSNRDKTLGTIALRWISLLTKKF